jgi:hypothetical protein
MQPSVAEKASDFETSISKETYTNCRINLEVGFLVLQVFGNEGYIDW